MSDATAQVAPVEDVVVVGTGFVGLPLALLLAANGKRVCGVDIDENLVEAINDASLNLDEAKLQSLFEDDAVQANLHAQSEPRSADAFVISVPTPLSEPEKSPDLSHVEAAIDAIIPYLEQGDLINVESTVPPQTHSRVIAPELAAAGFEPGEDVQLAHSPERILPGNVFEEIVANDRIIGGIDDASARRAAKVYEPFLDGAVYYTGLVSAELCKLMENTYRDVNVALANEFALIGQELDVDASEVISLANNHPRVDILQPGIGVGGHCLPVDPWFLNESDPEHTNLITTARRINDMMPRIAARKVRLAVRDYKSPRILALGATYKPGTYDIRNSPAMEVVERLREEGYDIDHYDRHVDGMGYETLETLLDETDPDFLLQLVPHGDTSGEIETARPVLDERDVGLLQFGVGDPLEPRE